MALPFVPSASATPSFGFESASRDVILAGNKASNSKDGRRGGSKREDTSISDSRPSGVVAPLPTSPASSRSTSNSPTSRTLSQWHSFNPLYSSLAGVGNLEDSSSLETGEPLLEDGDSPSYPDYRHHRVCTLGRLSAAVVSACVLVLLSLATNCPHSSGPFCSQRWSPLLWGRKSGEETSNLAGAGEAAPPAQPPAIPPGNENLQWCGHAPVKEFPKIFPYSQPELKEPVRVLTFNLYWWNLFGQRGGAGGIAGHLIRDQSKDHPFDFMGFQECEDVGRVLWDGGMDKDYTTNSSNHAICMAYRKDKWTQLDSGYEEIAEDRSAQYFGNRAVQWMRAQSKQQPEVFVFFMNHHGPLPVDSGGKCGGMATAWHLMDIMNKHAKQGDAIILVGDFNAGDSAPTVLELEQYMNRAYSGVAFGGVDNFFTNLDAQSVMKRENLGTGGSDHDALSATFYLRPTQSIGTKQMAHAGDRCKSVLYEVDQSFAGLYTIQYVDGGPCPSPAALSSPSVASNSSAYRCLYLTLDDATGVVSFSSPDPNKATKLQREEEPNWEVSYSAADGRVLVPGEDNIVRASPGQQAAQHWHQELNPDGTFNYKDEANEYMKVTANGALAPTTRNKTEASRFSVVSTTWTYPVNFVPNEDMCCTMCTMKWGCQTWTFVANAGLGGPWPGQCWLKGGGQILPDRPSKKGVISGLPGPQVLR